jgi:hypothetical protein
MAVMGNASFSSRFEKRDNRGVERTMQGQAYHQIAALRSHHMLCWNSFLPVRAPQGNKENHGEKIVPIHHDGCGLEEKMVSPSISCECSVASNLAV